MTQMTFKEAVDNTPELTNAYHSGQQALKKADRDRLVYNNNDSHRLTGSINLDDVLQNIYPHDSRWDYGIGWQMKNNIECAIWIEVHSANSNHVKEVIEKVLWLKNWLRNKAADLKKITKPENGFVWIATGAVAFQKGTSQAKRLAEAGVSFPQKILLLKEE